MALQIEIADKIKSLMYFQKSLNSRCSEILRRTDYFILSRPNYSERPQVGALQVGSTKFVLNPRFLSHQRQKPWFDTASDTINESDMMEILEWLESGEAYTTYADPARWVKLLLDQETAISYDKMLLVKHGSGKKIIIGVLVNVLCELITSRP